ncbi:ATP-binding protein [Devosia pacifica]|uniref:ATP-binding protein n=1 Tax=Devosia pacifica TaxID=1335967 RepID=A0A918RXF6_9HYPH|nr:ABC-F family ATP-binding cassette domain-containing protein [Devosia pacifica]GHA14710.1 ATP-binding protein [Devosia pacifica]
MPAITLARLSYVTPDNQPLFSDLDLSFGPLRAGLVGRNGTGKSSLLRLILGELQPLSGTVGVDGSVGVLRQHVQVAETARIANYLGFASQFDVLARLEKGEGSVEDAGVADWTLIERYEEAMHRVGLPPLDPNRLCATLSGGQRTRVALAGLWLTEPDFILLDEPTNNLDVDGRAAVGDLLAEWKGGAIVVSHDRRLLQQMDEIVELTSLGATTYGGNWDHYRQRKTQELAAAEHRLSTAEQHLKAIDQRIQAQAERKARSDSAGKKKRARGDQPKMFLDAQANRADATASRQAGIAGRMRAKADEQAKAARDDIEVLQPVSLSLPTTGLPAGKQVLEATDLTGGHDVTYPAIRNFNLRVSGPERIAIIGANGSGKTTLLKLLTGALKPMSGSVRVRAEFALLDQSVSILDPSLSVRENYRLLQPDEDENACRAALARLKFRAEAALQRVGTLSGGEMLRAGLAVTIGSAHPPKLLILDEPTNHLDLDAIQAVEAGLNAFDGALLVVSHDQAFLDNIGITRQIEL